MLNKWILWTVSGKPDEHSDDFLVTLSQGLVLLAALYLFACGMLIQ